MEARVETTNTLEANDLTLTQWFKNVWLGVTTAFKGLMITFRYVYAVKPISIEYPEVREVLPDNSRSRLYNDVQNCISCYQCATACPVDCIYITAAKRPDDAPPLKASNGNPIRLDLKQFTIDTGLCCYCGLCTSVCPTNCLTHTTDYEFAAYTIDDLKFDYLAEDIKAWRDRIVR